MNKMITYPNAPGQFYVLTASPHTAATHNAAWRREHEATQALRFHNELDARNYISAFFPALPQANFVVCDAPTAA
jgi:hypothetical protein